MARWPTKPLAGATCDAYTGWDADSHGKPMVHRCENPAVETCKATRGVILETWLCKEHAGDMAKRGLVVRNPKRK